MESKKIAAALEKLYPSPSLHLDSPYQAKIEEIMPHVMTSLAGIYIHYDPTTRLLSLTGTGSRQVASKGRRLEALVPVVVTLVQESPGLTGYRIDKELKDRGVSLQRGDGSKAANLAVDRGLLDSATGPRNSTRYLPR
jgi:hypothetical protein